MINQSSIQRGFSLMELMVVTTIISALMIVTLPSLSSMLQRKDINNITRDLAATFTLAEKTAARISDIVIICPITPDHTCDSNDWSQGWGLYRLDRTLQTTSFKLIKRFEGSEETHIKSNIMKIPIKKDGFYHIKGKRRIKICNENQNDYWSNLIVNKRGYTIVNHHFDENTTRCSS